MMTLMPERKFDSVWRKYRPAILRLMVDASKSPQSYKFAPHEFTRLERRPKSHYSFALTVLKSKSVHNIRASDIAHDLLHVLRDSKTANELFQSNAYNFVMDSKYVLHINIASEAGGADVPASA
jgi:hypothetical protein